jgi:Ca2+/Na+ antiporter
MKPIRTSSLVGLVVTALWLALPAAASACAACMGDPRTKVAGAINGAIFLMLGFVALMLGAFAAFAFHLNRRAQSPPPPHVEFPPTPDQPQDS